MWPQNLGDAKACGVRLRDASRIPGVVQSQACIQTIVQGVNLASLRICPRGPSGLWGTRRVFPRQHLLPGDVYQGNSEPSGYADIPGIGMVSVQGKRWMAMAKPQAHILREHLFGTGRRTQDAKRG